MSTHLAVKDDVTVNFSLPKKYKVILLNDDHTPMAFVIELLVGIFHKSAAEAENITMEVHSNGKGIAGIYYYEVAEQKVFEAVNVSRNAGYPLSLDLEEE